MSTQTIVQESIQISCEDNMELMSRYDDNHFDLAIVDPPYGSDSDATKTFTSNSKNKAAVRKQYKQFNNVQPPPEYFTELMRVSKNQIIWGVNFYKGVDLSGGRICWDKKGTAFGRAELAYYSGSKSVNVYEYIWNGMLQQNMKSKEIRIHPTQKPIGLYTWLLSEYAKPDFKILDTHIGSGSIAIAVDSVNKVEKMNLTLTGCEIDKDYYEKTMLRIKEQTSWQSLF